MLKVSTLTKKYGKVTVGESFFEVNGSEVCAIITNSAGKALPSNASAAASLKCQNCSIH